MLEREESVRGCLLGMAVGDAMGYPVNRKSWDEIAEAYGPNGLLGYDLTGGNAEITSYTQFAAYSCNGLLLGAMRGHTDKYLKYIALSLREWAKAQQFRGVAEKTFCWLAQVPEMRRRLCMDTRIPDALRREVLGTPENPVFRTDCPGILPVAVAVGILFDPQKMTWDAMRRLAMNGVALVTGDPMTLLTGAVIATAVALILQNPDAPLLSHFTKAWEDTQTQFGNVYPEAAKLSQLLAYAVSLTKDGELSPLAAMTLLGCETAPQVLGGAIYASLIHSGNFDEGMIAAVNHSGKSCATGMLTGAFLGARLGASALPDFYLESLDAARFLEELSADLVQGRKSALIFDDSWDQKYTQGKPV